MACELRSLESGFVAALISNPPIFCPVSEEGALFHLFILDCFFEPPEE